MPHCPAKTFMLATIFVLALLATPAAQAQYMVIEGNTTSNLGSQINADASGQSMYIQDYSDVRGIDNFNSSNETGLSSTAVLNGMFGGYLGIFSAFIGISAVAMAALRLFVKGQSGQTRNRLKRSQIFLDPVQQRIDNRFSFFSCG